MHKEPLDVANVKAVVDEDAVRRFLRRGEPTEVRCHLPGEEATTFHVDTLDHLETIVRSASCYAVPRALIIADLDAAVLLQALEAAVETERSCHYRPWLKRPRSEESRRLDRITYYGVLEEISPADGWVDVLAHLGNGEEYTFTVETVPSLRDAMFDDPNEAGWYYGPDPLVVRELRPQHIEEALRRIAPLGIERYGILSLRPDDE